MDDATNAALELDTAIQLPADLMPLVSRCAHKLGLNTSEFVAQTMGEVCSMIMSMPQPESQLIIPS